MAVWGWTRWRKWCAPGQRSGGGECGVRQGRCQGEGAGAAGSGSEREFAAGVGIAEVRGQIAEVLYASEFYCRTSRIAAGVDGGLHEQEIGESAGERRVETA